MNKGFILPIALLLGVILLTGFVLAMWNSNTNEITIPIKSGWNLIPIATWESAQPSSTIQASDFQYGFFYDVNSKKYKLIIENGKLFTDELASKLEEFSRSAIWVYSRKSGELVLSWNAFQNRNIYDISNYQLKSGWNFVSITPNFIGKSIDSINGNCNIISTYAWNVIDGTWTALNFTRTLSTEAGGIGLIVKVENDCTLKVNGDSVVSPPALPSDISNPNNTNSCTKSKEETSDYYISTAGEITFNGTQYLDFCVEKIESIKGNAPVQIFIKVNDVNFTSGTMGYDYTGKYKEVDPTCAGNNCYVAETVCKNSLGFYEIMKCDYCARGNCRVN